ncbi:MAG: translation initiation factor IF-5A [Canidatus Methanoxibalbensis ujae]|nr:translation initiation factor IF-5A [Candidatus Methanoxibalbensis ujae]MCW7079019.1 translation initiation factor IF-5A [Candidatus Methanoxibalbensis ujae]RLG37544.1 MAG: translation initiation factor IF-5A [Methanosarcinales archaeon]
MKEMTEVRMLKEGKYVLIDDEPCTIVSMTTSKPGKHGAAKARIEGIGVFDSQKRTAILPVTAKIYVPIIERRTGQVLSVMGDTAQVMDLETYETIELKIPPEVLERGLIEPGREVPFLHYEGKYKMDLKV